MTFKKYEQQKKGNEPEITMYKGGLIYITASLLLDIKKPAYVDLYWDAETESIGVKAGDDFKVKYDVHIASIGAQRFMKQFNILGRKAQRSLAQFNSEDEMIVARFGGQK